MFEQLVGQFAADIRDETEPGAERVGVIRRDDLGQRLALFADYEMAGFRGHHLHRRGLIP
jgi:hypothetical protein